MPTVPGRQPWIDYLRAAIIVLVVNMHACVTYSHVGSWYINEGPEPPLAEKIPFIFWQGHLQAFFMGLLFFLAGVFAQRSLQRRGPAAFVRERAFRLGLPSLLYMLVIHPFMVYVQLGHPRIPNRPSLGVLYKDYLLSGRVLSGNGPLWFALALLAFSVAFAGWRSLRPASRVEEGQTVRAPSTAALLLFGCILVSTTFAMRLVQPLGTNVLNFQLCFFLNMSRPSSPGSQRGVTAGWRNWRPRNELKLRAGSGSWAARSYSSASWRSVAHPPKAVRTFTKAAGTAKPLDSHYGNSWPVSRSDWECWRFSEKRFAEKADRSNGCPTAPSRFMSCIRLCLWL